MVSKTFLGVFYWWTLVVTFLTFLTSFSGHFLVHARPAPQDNLPSTQGEVDAEAYDVCWRSSGESPWNNATAWAEESDEPASSVQSPKLQKRNQKPPIFYIDNTGTVGGRCKLTGIKQAHVQPLDYPGIKELTKYPLAQYWFIPGKGYDRFTKCGHVGIQRKSSWDQIDGKIIPPKETPYRFFSSEYGVSDLSVDHVYEVNTLTNFFRYVLDNHEIDCDELQSDLMGVDTLPGRNNQPILQSVYDQLASYYHVDLAGVERGVNNFKSYFFFSSESIAVPDACHGKGDNEWRVQCMWDTTTALEFLNEPNVGLAYTRTNARIYGAMLGLDDNPNIVKPTVAGSWAGLYQTYMDEMILDINLSIYALYKSWESDTFLSSMPAGPSSARLFAGQKSWLAKYLYVRPMLDRTTLLGPTPYPAHYKVAIGKREEGKEDLSTITAPPSASSTRPPGERLASSVSSALAAEMVTLPTPPPEYLSALR